ncbi:MAG: peptide-methionine (S)-S-oxide reductase [Bradymonadales bacterium]|nr:MAG: peptide-methionine (S)-S-oxide reductase [Bradymonadales bacterium]
MDVAVFAAGCFWGVEEYFLRLPGVRSTQVGYTGGKTLEPSYEQVCRTETGHAEAVRVEFDSNEISYAELLSHFWRMHDPSSYHRQGPDIGSQYRSAIFFTNEEQRQLAELSRSQKLAAGQKIVTEITALEKFWPAEDYHQQYLRKNPQAGCHIALPPLKENSA